jgi:pimeloyl-ACP methyl ester carboxylesterase
VSDQLGRPAGDRGHVVSLGGREIHLVSSPGPGPVIVFLGGCGVPSYHWEQVVERLGPSRTVLMDRPGLLGTRWPGTLPTLDDEIATLADLVGRIPAPVFLVGHSMAGPHVEAFARLHPEKLGGLVMIDASVEWRVHHQRSGAPWLAASRFVYAATAWRPLRLIGSATDRVATAWMSDRRITDPVRPVARAAYRNRDVMASVVAEQAAYSQQMHDLADLRRLHPWPGVPTIVLAAMRNQGRGWRTKQRWLADLLRAEYREVSQSRHMMMLDDPAAIAAAVRSLVSRVPAAAATP